jgi:hypothetical protein
LGKIYTNDLGLDFGFLQNRISGEIDYYDKKTDGLLYDKIYHILLVILICIEMRRFKNNGFEFVLNTKNIKLNLFLGF